MSPNSEPTGDALGTATITNTVSTFTAYDLVIPNLVISNESIYKIISIAKAPF
jgi:hypothetical protein